VFAGESGAIGGVLWRRGRAEFACSQVIVGTKSNRQYDDIARERYKAKETRMAIHTMTNLFFVFAFEFDATRRTT
jgi:hypothetical protein